MNFTDLDLHRKTDRELRLHWQSSLILALVLLPVTMGLALRTLPTWTPASAEGLAICTAFGLLVWLLHAATPFAAVTGFLHTTSLYLGTVTQPHGGWFHTALLPGLALFVLAFAATRFRRSQKEQTGFAESRRGRRASQVAANMGIAALAAIMLPPYSPSSDTPALHTLISSSLSYASALTHIAPTAIATTAILTAIIAALGEAAADTVSSEIGQAIGGPPVLITTGRRVPPGADGAITLIGTTAGCVAAAIVVLIAMPTLGLSPKQAAIAWAAAIAGLFADSLIGATLERKGWLNNDAVNFLSTTIAALIALLA